MRAPIAHLDPSMPCCFRSVTLRPLAAGALALLPLAAGAQQPGAARAAQGSLPVTASAALPAPVAPFTRAERTQYAETSTYDDVRAVLASLAAQGAPIVLDTLGRTAEGRLLPLVIASRPLVHSPAEARRLRRPVVLVQANIHAGEVEGKEAMQSLLRDLSRIRGKSLLDSIVLLVIPIYNADGNEKFSPQGTQRTEQNGPELVGQRPNGMGLDLNRDYVKAEAPETRGALAVFNAWDPDLFIDLHTTDGSYHGYQLTYAPSLHPAAMLMPWVRDTLLPAVRARLRDRHNIAAFDYGNFPSDRRESVTDTVKGGWFTYDHRQRFGTNYYGLRGRLSVLSEAYSHDPFEVRIRATYLFVHEVLSYVAERPAKVRALVRAADAAGGWPAAQPLPLRAEITKQPRLLPVVLEQLVRDSSAERTQPGVPKGLRRSGRYITQVMPVADRFVPTVTTALPAGWVLDAAMEPIVDRLRLHGVRVERLAAPAHAQTAGWIVDSVVTSARQFQGHREVRLVVRLVPPADGAGPAELAAGSFVVRRAQPLGALAALLLEPGSDDSFATWNALDAQLAPGSPYPLRRLLTPPAVRRTPAR